MALVKMVRDIPEVKGGATTAMIAEESVQAAVGRGWRRAESKAEGKQDPAKAVEERPVAKTEEKKEEKKSDAPKSKNSKMRDA